MLSISVLVTYIWKPTQEQILEQSSKSPICQLTIMWPWGSCIHSVCFSFSSLKWGWFILHDLLLRIKRGTHLYSLRVLLSFLWDYILSLSDLVLFYNFNYQHHVDDPQIFLSRLTLFLGSVLHSKTLSYPPTWISFTQFHVNVSKQTTLFPLLSNFDPISDFPAANIIIIFPIMQAD